jgi:hypothetical protein
MNDERKRAGLMTGTFVYMEIIALSITQVIQTYNSLKLASFLRFEEK